MWWRWQQRHCSGKGTACATLYVDDAAFQPAGATGRMRLIPKRAVSEKSELMTCGYRLVRRAAQDAHAQSPCRLCVHTAKVWAAMAGLPTAYSEPRPIVPGTRGISPSCIAHLPTHAQPHSGGQPGREVVRKSAVLRSRLAIFTRHCDCCMISTRGGTHDLRWRPRPEASHTRALHIQRGRLLRRDALLGLPLREPLCWMPG